MKMIKSIFMILQVLWLVISQNLFSQTPTTPQPDIAPGTNSVSYNSSTQTYNFYLNSVCLYSFYASPTNGTLNNLHAYDNSGSYFLPSDYGGPLGSSFYPWDNNVTYFLISNQLAADNSVQIKYQISCNGISFNYQYTFKISGRTLIIKAVSFDTQNCAGFDLDRCENASNPKVIRVPYLTLFNLLYSNNLYTSMFFDWETTNASSLNPKTPDIYNIVINGVASTTSKRFTQVALYNQLTNGKRNPLSETIYLTTSPSINNVLPNIVMPSNPSPNYGAYKDSIANRIVLSWGPPYTYLNNPPQCSYYTVASLDAEFQNIANAHSDALVSYLGIKYYNTLNLLSDMGIQGLAIILQTYQRLGFDRGYPNVLPANTFANCLFNCSALASEGNSNSSSHNGNSQLIQLKTNAINKGYLLALHENYADAYLEDNSGFNTADVALGSYNKPKRNWVNCNNDTSYVISPGKAAKYINTYSNLIKNQISPNWSYLDVHTAINAPDVIDYDANKPGAGKFSYVVQQYRNMPSIISSYYNGPVEGEGGSKHSFIYIGYFHDLEARLHTADYNIYGAKTPLFVDFDLYKMHGKSAFHGVGHFYSFYAPDPDHIYNEGFMTLDQMLKYIAYELAFGHSGFITKCNVSDHTIKQAQLEYNYVYPVQKLYKNATPTSILYFKNSSPVGDASTYIQKNPNYFDIANTDFMSQVKVTYSNGIIVWVNTSPIYSWDFTPFGSGTYYFNKMTNGARTQGKYSTTTVAQFSMVELPQNNGWLVYVPEGLAPK
jgi:hypothetical protein